MNTRAGAFVPKTGEDDLSSNEFGAKRLAVLARSCVYAVEVITIIRESPLRVSRQLLVCTCMCACVYGATRRL